MKLRSARIAVAFMLLTGALTACGPKRAESVSAPPAGAVQSASVKAAGGSLSEPARSESGAPGCYRESNIGEGWDFLAGFSTEESCFAADSCTGGLGHSAGGCYKWAIGPEAPALSWTFPVVEPTSISDPSRSADGPPVDNGLYAIRTPCVAAEGCVAHPWIAKARIPLHAQPDPASPVVAWIEVGEAASTAEDVEYIVPKRGVLEEGESDSPAGNVVYKLNEHCLGKYFDVWRRGEVLTGWDDAGIRWDPVPGLRNRRYGSWRQLERANGQRGWVRSDVVAEPSMSPGKQTADAASAAQAAQAAQDDEDSDGCE